MKTVFFFFYFALIFTSVAPAAVDGLKPLDSPKVIGRVHLNFENELKTVQKILREEALEKKNLLQKLEKYLGSRQRVLGDRKQNLSLLREVLRVGNGSRTILAVEQSAVELAARRIKLNMLRNQLSKLVSTEIGIPNFRATIEDVFLVVAGEEFYLDLSKENEELLAIFPSEGEVKNQRVSTNPQLSYKKVSEKFRTEISEFSLDPRRAERVFQHFVQNYHLYVAHWEARVTSVSSDLPDIDRRILKKHLMSLEDFFKWNNRRDIAMVQRVSRLKGDKIFLTGSGHQASLKKKIESFSRRL